MSLLYKLQKETGRCARILMILILALLLLAQTAAADDSDAVEPTVDPIRNNDNYSAVVYDNTNGLPAAEANAIVQTSEGFIWIGCYAGLVRYDGNTFERLDSTQGVNSISCLYVDKQDRLWIGTNDNGLAVMENGEFTSTRHYNCWPKINWQSLHTGNMVEYRLLPVIILLKPLC